MNYQDGLFMKTDNYVRQNSSKSNLLSLNYAFFILLAATAVLLVSLVLALTVMTISDASADPNKDNTIDNGGTDSTPIGSGAINVGANNSPLFPTTPSRSSYIIGQAADVKTIDSTAIKSQHSILVKLSTYQSIAEKSADVKIYPASMTKVMTLIIACENVTDVQKKLTVTEKIAKFASDNDGSGAGLKVGESYTVEDLLYLISYQSDTIASILIAEEVAGSEENFVKLMNDKVKALGLGSTKFTNCTGLYDDNNYTTCREMASIMAYALDNEKVYSCLSSYSGRPMTVGGNDCTFYSGWYSYRFDDNPKFSGGKIVAGKTGYTDESGYTLVSCAVIDGERYINVIVTRTNKSSTVKVQEGPSAAEVKYIYENYSK